jgi:hypothetical protein
MWNEWIKQKEKIRFVLNKRIKHPVNAVFVLEFKQTKKNVYEEIWWFWFVNIFARFFF